MLSNFLYFSRNERKTEHLFSKKLPLFFMNIKKRMIFYNHPLFIHVNVAKSVQRAIYCSYKIHSIIGHTSYINEVDPIVRLFFFQQNSAMMNARYI